MSGIDAPGGREVPRDDGAVSDPSREPRAFPDRPTTPPASDPKSFGPEAGLATSEPKSGSATAGSETPGGSSGAASDDPAKQVCGALRLDLGAYVLGTLDETERQWIRSHVAVCPDCRAEYDQLAVLPSFLARLTPAEAEAGGVAAEQPPARLLAAAAERLRREHRTRRVLIAAAAAFCVLVGTLGWVLGSDDDSGAPVAAPPTASGAPTGPPPSGPVPSTPPPGVRNVQASDPGSGAGMTLAYRPVPWGTAIDMQLSGVSPGTRCQLDVFGTRGRQETASSWVVPPGGYGAPGGWSLPGGTSISPDEITRFQVSVVGSDEVLLSVKAQQNPTTSP